MWDARGCPLRHKSTRTLANRALPLASHEENAGGISVDVVLLPMQRGVGLDDEALMSDLLELVH